MSTAQLILIILNVCLSIIGGIIALSVKRLYQSIDALSHKDSQLESTMNAHREDVLKNYTSSSELDTLRSEFTKRFDRFEDTILNAIRRIPGP